ncbi:MAG TPA: 2-C-methyl-D-erythritol 4-phosphate cytidylyltransferase [Casimicrobiaceae bacterium]|nr:2-C-methyl-D-erythritol 4-phosphate cytidylyltransferase [Casimicrobiaceae bacterium]
MRFFALIPAAGTGARFGGAVPKQYAMLDGAPLLGHALARLREHVPLEEPPRVLLAHDDSWFDRFDSLPSQGIALRCGGATRAHTVRNGLDSLVGIASDDDWVLVHDAARPCIDAASLRRLQREIADDEVGGLLAIPALATIKRADSEGRVVRTEAREGLWLAQTPQVFRFGLLREALSKDDIARFTDEAQAIEALGLHPRLIEGSSMNIKITLADDLELASAILAQQRRQRAGNAMT